MNAPEAPSAAPKLHCVERYGHPSADGSLLDAMQSQDLWFKHLQDPVDVILVQAAATDAIAWCAAQGLQPDLVYIDPPYASHRDYVFTQKHPVDGSKVSRVVFGDRWAEGMEEYVEMLRPIVQGTHALLQAEGSFLLHVDPRGGPYLSILCDRIFGMGIRSPQKHHPGFRNELIWRYGLGGSSPTSWPRKHDNIYWYSKASTWYFDPPMTPATSARMRGQMKKQPDVIDVPTINNMAKDRTGYPTQKPIELLEMLIKAHTPTDALVMDFFSGSGTTALAAFLHGRRAVVSDISPDAIAVTRARLLDAGARVAVFRAKDVPPTDAPDPTALVFERLGTRTPGGMFQTTDPAHATHRIRRDVEGNEAIEPLPTTP